MNERKIDPKLTPEREQFYARLSQYALAPLWERLNILLTKTPQVASQPCLWDYEACKSLLFESAELISAEEAERRVLVLDNPGLNGASAITETLYAGWQLLMPGEVAPAHRHTPSALRFIMDGDGTAYTAVNGETAYMRPGYMLLTPSMQWHDHGHEGEEPIVWLDVLDIPYIRNLGTIFFDLYPEERYAEQRPTGLSKSQFGVGLKPIEGEYDKINSPMFFYPFSETRKALMEVVSAQDTDPLVGCKLEYINPTNGQGALSTISTFLQFMPASFSSSAYRSTEGMVFSIIEGAGKVVIEHQGKQFKYTFKPKDTFVIPCWGKQQWEIELDTVLFCASDKVLQERLGLWRQEVCNG